MMDVQIEPFSKFVSKTFIVDGIYPHFILTHDRQGRKRTFNFGELIQNGYGPRITVPQV